MRKGTSILVALLAVGLLGLGSAGCGDGDSGSGSTGSTQQAGADAESVGATQGVGGGARDGSQSSEDRSGGSGADSAEDFTPKPHSDSGGGSAQFEVEGGDNSVQEFGEEASEAELQEAASALHGFLDARAERKWAAACGYLAVSVRRSFGQLASDSEGQDCADALEGLSAGLPQSSLREAAVADAGSLRVQGDRAFVIYRGARGVVYAIPMARDGGGWKVASLAGVPLT